MKTTHSIAFGIAMMLAAACGNEEPAKTATQASPPPSPVQPAPTPVAEAPTPAATESIPTSADIPKEGPLVGSTETQPAVTLTDGQILEITHTANAGEIDQAKVALSRSKDARVRSLAQMMVRDHSQADKKGMILAKKDNLEREPSPKSAVLLSDGEATMRTLKADAAADFDKDYVDTQVREHQSVLDALDNKLIVSATNADLKAYLGEIRAAVASHLQHAQDLQTEMQKDPQK